MVTYFNTTYAAVDWILLGCNSGTVTASPYIAWIALKHAFCKKIHDYR